MTNLDLLLRQLDPPVVTPKSKQVQPRYRCNNCQHEFSDKPYRGRVGCPKCKRSGDRLSVTWLNTNEVVRSKYGIKR